MSTANIIDMHPISASEILVRFQCQHGSGQGEIHSYVYSGVAAKAILGGADPSGFTPDSGSGAAAIVSTAIDIAEIAGGLA
jgi:hypothetical protein